MRAEGPLFPRYDDKQLTTASVPPCANAEEIIQMFTDAYLMRRMEVKPSVAALRGSTCPDFCRRSPPASSSSFC